MAHRAHPEFWMHYRRLPADVRDLADKSFQFMQNNPRHPSLRLKKIGQFWSVRVGQNYRAVAIEIPGGLLWTWIGSHEAYEALLKS